MPTPQKNSDLQLGAITVERLQQLCQQQSYFNGYVEIEQGIVCDLHVDIGLSFSPNYSCAVKRLSAFVRKVIYTVRKGDTLSSISAKYGISIHQIVTDNNIINPDHIQIGDVFVLHLNRWIEREIEPPLFAQQTFRHPYEYATATSSVDKPWYEDIADSLNDLLNELTSASNKEATPWNVGVEWLTGRGPRERNFKDGDYFTELLKQHPHIRETREKIRTTVTNYNDTIIDYPYKLSGISGVGKYMADASTLLTLGKTGNLAVTYLGSFSLKVDLKLNKSCRTATLTYMISNPTSLESGTRPPVLGYSEFWKKYIGPMINSVVISGPMSKTYQTFTWTEIIHY